MDLDTQEVTRLTHNPGGDEWASSPSWSPDGKHIAYRQATPPNGLTTIYVMRPDGTRQVPLVLGADGEVELFEDRAVIQKHGAKARRILKTPKKWHIHSACFIDHDVLLAADKNPEPGTKADIYRYHISTGKLTNLTNHPADDLAPHWISDTVFSVTPLKKKAIQWGTLKQRNKP